MLFALFFSLILVNLSYVILRGVHEDVKLSLKICKEIKKVLYMS